MSERQEAAANIAKEVKIEEHLEQAMGDGTSRKRVKVILVISAIVCGICSTIPNYVYSAPQPQCW